MVNGVIGAHITTQDNCCTNPAFANSPGGCRPGTPTGDCTVIEDVINGGFRTPVQSDVGSIIYNTSANGGGVGAQLAAETLTAVGPGSGTGMSNSEFGILNACVGPAPSGCPGCNGGNHVWANMQNWQNNFDQIIANFIQNSANPLQPCLFLQQKIDQWTTVQAGVGNANAPCNAYWNQLECKIKHATILQQTHNC